MKAVTESILAAPAPRRDVLAGLLLQVLKNPNAGIESQARACATISQAFAWLDQSDDRLAVRHHNLREASLVRALATALKIVQQVHVDLAVDIVAELESDIRPLIGEPIVLSFTDPYNRHDEGKLACETLDAFHQERGAR